MCSEFTGSTQPKLCIQASMDWSHLCSENLEPYFVLPVSTGMISFWKLPKVGLSLVDDADYSFYQKCLKMTVKKHILFSASRKYWIKCLTLLPRIVWNLDREGFLYLLLAGLYLDKETPKRTLPGLWEAHPMVHWHCKWRQGGTKSNKGGEIVAHMYGILLRFSASVLRKNPSIWFFHVLESSSLSFL